MKKIILILIVVSACSKSDPEHFNEVLFSITYECQAKFKIYNVTDGQQYISDIADCEHVSTIPLQIEPREYKVVAENPSGDIVIKDFTKTKYS